MTRPGALLASNGLFFFSIPFQRRSFIRGVVVSSHVTRFYRTFGVYVWLWWWFFISSVLMRLCEIHKVSEEKYRIVFSLLFLYKFLAKGLKR